jgi:glycosyltransferase involved in cell wall biosynthesis
VREPLVSILIAAYNAEPFIEQTLRSVLGQSWKRTEVIVVDDGSSDRTSEIVGRYAEHPHVTLLHQANRGQCAARNRAARHARGDFIKFLDADDLLAPQAIALQVERLLDSPECVASADWCRFYDDPSRPWFVPEAMWEDLDPVTWLVRAWTAGGGMTQCGVFLIPRLVLARSGLWNESLTLIDDFEFFARVLLSSKGVRFARGATLYYRSGLPGSVSSSRSRVAIESAHASIQLATERLLATENSPRTRAACAAVHQAFVYNYYPEHMDLVQDMERRAAALGGTALLPDGTRGFHVLRRVIGWRLARRFERLALRYGITRSGLRQKTRIARGRASKSDGDRSKELGALS